MLKIIKYSIFLFIYSISSAFEPLSNSGIPSEIQAIIADYAADSFEEKPELLNIYADAILSLPGNKIALYCIDKTVKIINAETNKIIHSTFYPLDSSLKPELFNTAGNLFVLYSDGMYVIFSSQTGKATGSYLNNKSFYFNWSQVKTLEQITSDFIKNLPRGYLSIFLKDNLLATVKDNAIVMENRSNQTNYNFAEHDADITAMIELGNNKFASADLNGTIIIWIGLSGGALKLQSFRCKTKIPEDGYPYSIMHLAKLFDNILVSINCSNQIELWDITIGKILQRFYLPDYISCDGMTVSEKGDLFILGHSQVLKFKNRKAKLLAKQAKPEQSSCTIL